MSIFKSVLSIILIFLCNSAFAQETTPFSLEASNALVTPNSSSELPPILQEFSFIEQSTLVVEEIIYNPDNIHHNTGQPTVNTIKIAFYDAFDTLLFKANFDPSYLLARRLENGEIGYYFEGVAFELESADGEITETYDGRYLTDSIREPTLQLSTYVGLEYNISGRTNITVSQHKGALGQIVGIFSSSGSPEDVFSLDYE